MTTGGEVRYLDARGGEFRWWGWAGMRAMPPEAMWARSVREVTYGRLCHEVDALRTRLSGLEVGPGSRVALQVPTSFTMLWWLFALWSLGATVLLLDPRMKPAETATAVRVIRPRLLIEAVSAPSSLESFREEYATLVRPTDGALPADPAFCLVQCTSGSTVRRTWHSIQADVDRHAANPGMPKRGERVYLLSPPTFGFGLAAGALLSLRVGACLVFCPHPHPEELLEFACRADVHAIFGAPVHFDLLARASGTAVPPNLRLAVSCGDVLTARVRTCFERRYRLPLGQAYGMTETGALATDLDGRSDSLAIVGGLKVDLTHSQRSRRTSPPRARWTRKR